MIDRKQDYAASGASLSDRGIWHSANDQVRPVHELSRESALLEG